jgi:DNA polymerase-3 subunit delta
MKLSFKEIESFVKNPNKAARVILIYGPDQGLVQERLKVIGKSVVADLNDPFNAVTLQGDTLKDDPAAFFDEVQAQSLMGGERLIIIRQATDTLTLLLKDYLTDPSQDTLTIIEAGELGPRSSLRKLCEAAKNAVALPCYVDDEKDVIALIRSRLSHAGYCIEQNALTTFSSALVGDRAITVNEINKLILYKGWPENYNGIDGEQSQPQGQISIDDITACFGDVRDWSMDRLIYAVANKEIQTVSKILNAMLKDQIGPIVILRGLQAHFWRLHSVQSKLSSGENRDIALKSLYPPLFWKVKNDFIAQLDHWPKPLIERSLNYICETEVKLKQTGYDDKALLNNMVLNLAR